MLYKIIPIYGGLISSQQISSSEDILAFIRVLYKGQSSLRLNIYVTGQN